MISEPVCLRVKGPFACFTRPEFHVERVSYPIITPSAARGILEAILMKPVEKPEAAKRADKVGFKWHILRIGIIRKGFLMPLLRNELGYERHQSFGNVSGYDISDSDNRAQRHSLILRDVEYLIEAVMEVDENRFLGRKGVARLLAKYHNMFLRRARGGQCFYQPFLGCREFSASEWELVDGENVAKPDTSVEDNFGLMFRDFIFDSVWNHWGHEKGTVRPTEWVDTGNRDHCVHPVAQRPLLAAAKAGWVTVARVSTERMCVEEL